MAPKKGGKSPTKPKAEGAKVEGAEGKTKKKGRPKVHSGGFGWFTQWCGGWGLSCLCQTMLLWAVPLVIAAAWALDAVHAVHAQGHPRLRVICRRRRERASRCPGAAALLLLLPHDVRASA